MKDMLKNLEKMQAEMIALLKSLRVTGSAGGGMVKVEMDGEQNVLAVKIEPEIVQSGDVEMLQDLIRAALSDAQDKVKSQIREQLAKKTGLPFNFPM